MSSPVSGVVKVKRGWPDLIGACCNCCCDTYEGYRKLLPFTWPEKMAKYGVTVLGVRCLSPCRLFLGLH